MGRVGCGSRGCGSKGLWVEGCGWGVERVMKVKPNIGRLCLPREQHLVDNCSVITSYKAKRQWLQVNSSCLLAFHGTIAALRFVLLQLQLDCYDDDLSPMDNNNTVIFLLHVTFKIIYHREISLTFRTNYFCFQPTSMLQLTWFTLV